MCLSLSRYERLTIAHFDHSPVALTVFGSGDASVGDMMVFSDAMRPLVQGSHLNKPSKASHKFNSDLEYDLGLQVIMYALRFTAYLNSEQK